MKWKEITCLEEQVGLKLPEDWSRLSNEMVAKKFPYRRKPQEIYVSPDTCHIITLNIFGKTLHENQIYPAIKEIKRLISQMYPESIQESPRLFETKTGMAGYFSFVTGGIEYSNLHYMFVIPIGGRMMMGSSHFPETLIKEEQMIFLEVLKSIQEVVDTEEEKADKYGENRVRR